MKLFLFGQVGSGKSYVGELLQRRFGIPFYDADWDLPEALRNAIAAHQPITEAMRTEFTAAIVRRIALLEQGKKHFVIAQALFKNRHREHLIQTFPDLTLVWVRSSPSVASRRLHERVGHIASSYYAELINPGFEPPTHPHALIENVQNSRQLVSNLAQLLRGVTPKGTPNRRRSEQAFACR
jgi:gluconate kinase